MRLLRARRALAGLSVVIVALATPVSPSAAATTQVTWDVAAHLTTHWDGVTRLLNDPSATTICVPAGTGNPSVVTHVDDVTGATHIANGSGWSNIDPYDVNAGGTNYQIVIDGSVATTTGSLNPATNTFTQSISLRWRWLNCAGTAVLCTVTFNAHLQGHDYNGGAVPVTGNSVTLTGGLSGTVQPQIGCNAAIRPWIVGSTVSFAMHLMAH